MSILQHKKDIEQLVFDSWSDTDIHWSGQPFDISARDEWLRVQYEPLEVTHNGLSDTVYTYRGKIKMAVFATDEFRVYELMDTALTLFGNKQVGSNFDTNVNVIGIGKTEDGKYHYADMVVNITTF